MTSPGCLPVALPFSKTISPLTQTRSIPTESASGDSGVALVEHGIGIKENQVGLHARPDDAAILESHVRSGEPARFVDGRREVHDVALANVTARETAG